MAATELSRTENSDGDGVWDYSGIAEPEEWEKIDKTPTDWGEVEKLGENWNEIEKEVTNWSDGSVAGAEEWNYPLEDTG